MANAVAWERKEAGRAARGRGEHGRGAQDGHPLDPAVARLVAFQESGQGFGGVWADIGPTVESFARRSLRKNGVKHRFGDDVWAVDDVVSQTAERLLQLAGPDASGRFDPARAGKPGRSGLSGWLWRIVQRQAVNWTRNYRGGRTRGGRRTTKILAESSLVLNDRPNGGAESILKRAVAKPDRQDLLPVLEACIEKLPDPLMRRVMQLQLGEGLSDRGTARRLRVSVSRVLRQRRKSLPMLRGFIEEMGLDFELPAA